MHNRLLQTNRKASCDGKRQFESYSVAERASHRIDGEHLNVYHCRFCGHFHVGHSEGVSRTPRPHIEEDWRAEWAV